MSERKPPTTLCGLPLSSPNAVPAGTVAAVLGAAHSLGSPHDGAENAPFFLRTVSQTLTWSATAPGVLDLRHRLPLLDRLVDLGDLDFAGMTLTEALDAISTVIRDLPRGVAPCVIGGDHTITLAAVRGLTERDKRPITVVQFDHHLDLQIWDGAAVDTSFSREPVFHTNVMSHVSDLIGPGNLVQIGVSPYATVEDHEVDGLLGLLAAVGRQVSVTATELDDARAIESMVGEGKDLYVTVDIDVLDRVEMSSTAYPAPLGLRVPQLLRLIDWAVRRNRLVGFDVVEFAAARTDRTPSTLADSQRALLVFLHLLAWVRKQSAGRTTT
ncbi:arginase family protein [Streptomyces olivaceus]|uniref:arginase family protein n=1 Tax=Streptomyces olivaceus TaxID=47716 RepID=UPI001885A207|nr:arginase family protein [Streptomyces olivaceus]